MSERTAQILKIRWPEAVMLIGLFAGLSALGTRVTQEFYTSEEMAARLPFWSAFLLGAGLMTLIILLGMMFLGFLRSVQLQPLAPRQPMELLRLGQPFFWKVFLFYILFELVWMILTLLLTGFLYSMLFGQKESAQFPEWLLRFSQIAVLAMLVKPFLLIPGILLLKNNTIPQALADFRQISFFKMHRLVKAVWIGFGLLLAVFVLLYLIPFPEELLWIRIGLLSIVTGSVFLFLFLTALLEIQDRIKIEPQDGL